MKKVAVGCLIALVVVGVLVAVVVGVVFALTGDLPRTADAFFSDVAAGQYEKAYNEYLAADFRAGTSLEEMKEFLENSALADYRSASWSSREKKSGGEAELGGTVETKSDGRVPVTITFVKEGEAWKILSIKKAAAGMQTEGGEKPIPAESRLKAMVDETMQDFARAVNTRDFSNFYANISALWRAQTTREDLLNAFQPFVENEIDLSGLAEIEPVFSGTPGLDEQELLVLEGYYPGTPDSTHFVLKYTYEHPDWKLAGINVQMK